MPKLSKEELEKIQSELKRSRNLQKLLEEGVLSEQEVLGAFSDIAEVIKKHRKEVGTELTNFGRYIKTFVSDTDPRFLPVIKSLAKRADITEGGLTGVQKSISEAFRVIKGLAGAADVEEIAEELKELREMVNDMPAEFDSTDLESRVSEIEEKIEEILKEDKKEKKGFFGRRGGGGMNRAHVTDLDISDQLNGVDKTISIPAVYSIISVALSSFPNILRKGVDFTYTPTSITFTDEIDAASTLAAGQTCILTVINA
jgi:ElaB/YqjD/DUF883 family membrane-anchored ribosome-binding protein